MKEYLHIVWILLYIIISFGIVLPYLFSAASTVLVVTGVAYLVSMPIVVYWIWTN